MMEEKRKNAYRYLLYQFLLDIRTTPIFESALPSTWTDEQRDDRLKYAGSVAYLLHNFALQAATDFVGFDEAGFWANIETYNQREPKGYLTHFRYVFDGFLEGRFSCQLTN